MSSISVPLSPAPARSVDFRAAQWRVLAAIMICYLFFYTGRQNMGFAVKGMQESLGYSASAVAWLNAAMLAGYGLGQAMNGNFADIYGARRMVAIGAALSFAFNWAFSFTSTAWLAIVLWFANGLAQSTGSPAMRRLIVDWFPQGERGKANGFHLLSAGFSSSLTFGLCIWVTAAFDWRWVFRLPVSTILVGTAVFLVLARNRPVDLGFQPLPPEPSEEAPPEAGESSRERYLKVLRNRHFLLACISIGFESMARYGLLSWVPLHFLGTAKGSRADLWVTLGLPVGMAVGALSAGLVSDRWFPQRRAWVAAFLMACAALATFLLSMMPTGSPYAFALLAAAGFFVYAPQASYWSLGPVLVGRERSGTATGLMDASAYGFAALGQVLIGQTIDWTGSTFSVFLVIAVGCLLGALAILPLKK
ncbi:MAG: MFS transporter [Bryobacteraceae bacterium]|nr:MFS transporter [Bryobacteraceae bacterium]